MSSDRSLFDAIPPDYWDALGQYIHDTALYLRIGFWDITLDTTKPCKSSYGATIRPIYGRKCVNIRVNTEWAIFSRAQQKNTIIHELLHIHFFALQNVVTGTAHSMSPRTFYTLKEHHDREVEYTVDTLAAVLAEAWVDPPLLVAAEDEPVTEQETSWTTTKQSSLAYNEPESKPHRELVLPSSLTGS